MTIATDDDVLAAEVAERAGRLLLDLRRELGFPDAKRLRDEGDRRSNQLITGLLAEARPDDAVLSEEAVDDPRRLANRRVWIVDPLDGTREYAEQGRTDWAVHIALWSDGDLVTGAVAMPAEGQTLVTGMAPRPRPAPAGPPRLVVSRSRPPELVGHLARRLGMELVPMGSAGAKTMAVVRGDADAYVHAGGQYEWDSAAPVAVAKSHGLHACRIDGSELRYNRPDPLLPDLMVCRPELAAPILDALAAIGAT
ncbi:MAG: 3'(2'),5'-bisphosphate nucleotidase CysQ [Acidimicrobiia bacterium]